MLPECIGDGLLTDGKPTVSPASETATATNAQTTKNPGSTPTTGGQASSSSPVASSTAGAKSDAHMLTVGLEWLIGSFFIAFSIFFVGFM